MIASLAWALLALAQPPAPSPTARAEAVVRHLPSGHFDVVEAQFDDAMKAGLPPDNLATTWKSVTGQVGAFQKETTAREESTGPFKGRDRDLRLRGGDARCARRLRCERQDRRPEYADSTHAR